jgi:hypothetical protein
LSEIFREVKFSVELTFASGSSFIHEEKLINSTANNRREFRFSIIVNY